MGGEMSDNLTRSVISDIESFIAGGEMPARWVLAAWLSFLMSERKAEIVGDSAPPSDKAADAACRLIQS